MSLDKRISELREWIEGMPTMSDVIVAMREGNRERVDEIVDIEKRLKSDFNSVFTEFKDDSRNAEKLTEYASILQDLRPRMPINWLEKVVFLIYVNNSVEWVTMSFANVGSINFNQLVGEFIDWEKFKEHFWDSDIPDEFFETEAEDVVSHMWNTQEHMRAIFLAMKAKFQF